jgi:hypothetical protein
LRTGQGAGDLGRLDTGWVGCDGCGLLLPVSRGLGEVMRDGRPDSLPRFY